MKISSVVVCFGTLVAGASLADSDILSQSSGSPVSEEFLDLDEPDRNISGAYYGLGFTLSRISHSMKASRSGQEVSFKKADNQYDISLIGGFGSMFYKRYYAGIEMEFFRRFSGKTNYHSSGAIGLKHTSTVGLNMDVRFGYVFPKQGSLVYATIGCARVLGTVVSAEGVGRNARVQEGSFGSFYPTVGGGVEKKLNSRWNVRGDLRVSITSTDDNRRVRNWNFEAKPSRTALRVSVTRNI
jgi:hypothetical protein